MYEAFSYGTLFACTCPHTSALAYVCVLILLLRVPIYASSYSHALAHMCPRTTMRSPTYRHKSSLQGCALPWHGFFFFLFLSFVLSFFQFFFSTTVSIRGSAGALRYSCPVGVTFCFLGSREGVVASALLCYIYIYIYINKYIHTYIHTYYTYICLYTHTHTHTHTHICIYT